MQDWPERERYTAEDLLQIIRILRDRENGCPWDKVQTLQKGMTPGEIVKVLEDSCHSRLPVVDEQGTVIGMLQMRKYLKEYVLHPDKVSLLKVMDKPVFVQTGKVIDDLLEALSAERTHVAVVRDEQQKVVGIITVEDILEEIHGQETQKPREPQVRRKMQEPRERQGGGAADGAQLLESLLRDPEKLAGDLELLTRALQGLSDDLRRSAAQQKDGEADR